MASNLRPLLTRPAHNLILSRSLYYKFKRVRVPPLQDPKESPYIVGPYLKPDYLPRQYITEPIKSRDENDLDYFIYEPVPVEMDEERKVSLLLLDDVEGLGVAGQTVEAPYRASKLVAMKKAEYVSQFAETWYKFGPKTFQSASSALSPRTIRLLQNTIFRLPVAKNAIIQPWHLSLALRLSGCWCPAEAIEKESIVEELVENDEVLVKCIVRINNHERVEVRFMQVKPVSNK